jgi:hypothetical protein
MKMEKYRSHYRAHVLKNNILTYMRNLHGNMFVPDKKRWKSLLDKLE